MINSLPNNLISQTVGKRKQNKPFHVKHGRLKYYFSHNLASDLPKHQSRLPSRSHQRSQDRVGHSSDIYLLPVGTELIFILGMRKKAAYMASRRQREILTRSWF